MISLVLVLALFYGGMLLFLMAGCIRSTRAHSIPPATETGFSIVLPFRNEALALPGLLQSIAHLNYPNELFELLFVDDGSTDASASIITQANWPDGLRWKLLKNTPGSKAPKKTAISLGVQQARYPWILTTDADCQLPENWLQYYSAFVLKYQPKMICGPVALAPGSGMLFHYQQIELWALQVTTMGGFGWKKPLLCNGANLGFEKDAFEQVGGYTGNDDIASGDDLFLMEKIEDRFGGGVQFIKDRGAVVTTLGVTSWKDLLQQRIRWAAKTARQQNILNKIVGGIVLLTNAALVLLLIHSILTYDRLSPVLLGLLAFKLVIDMVYILPALRFFGSKLPLIYLLPVGLLYPLISCWTGIRSLCGGYRWKGRNHKR